MSNKVPLYLQQGLSDPNNVERVSRQMYGIPADELMSLMGVLGPLMRGHEIPAKDMTYIRQYAKERLGWNSEQTNSKLREMSQEQNPAQRLYSFLTAGGQPITEQLFNNVKSLTEAYNAEDMSESLTERLENSTSNQALSQRDRFEGMPASKSTLEGAQQRNSLRDQVAFMVKGPEGSSQKTMTDFRRDVMTARNRLADKIELDDDFDKPKSIRDSLSFQYDVAKISAASVEAGMGNVGEEMRDIESAYDRTTGADSDITEKLDSY